MSIAIDHQRLSQIVDEVLRQRVVDDGEAYAMVEFVRLAGGSDHDCAPKTRAIMETIVREIRSLSDLDPETTPMKVTPSELAPDRETRIRWLAALASQLRSHAARELTYVFAFLVSVADLELSLAERVTLEELQQVLGVDHRRATELTICVTDIVAA